MLPTSESGQNVTGLTSSSKIKNGLGTEQLLWPTYRWGNDTYTRMEIRDLHVHSFQQSLAE